MMLSPDERTSLTPAMSAGSAISITPPVPLAPPSQA
jgi:hypothetical protein